MRGAEILQWKDRFLAFADIVHKGDRAGRFNDAGVQGLPISQQVQNRVFIPGGHEVAPLGFAGAAERVPGERRVSAIRR